MSSKSALRKSAVSRHIWPMAASCTPIPSLVMLASTRLAARPYTTGSLSGLASGVIHGACVMSGAIQIKRNQLDDGGVSQ